jgi:hypothetical protein
MSLQQISDAPQQQECYYSLDPNTILVNASEGSISAQLKQECDFTLASELQLSLWFYQNGIIRALVDEENSDRFRITQEGIPVVDT